MSVVGLDIGSQTSFCGVARQGKIGFRINNIDIYGYIMGWAIQRALLETGLSVL